ncbi:unnamed protein product [Symbiodinium natans]|uniref:Uncharacterized protein n=1 Tax=Symbiodinium natans TaxID=878477 RepID=A0A812JCM8_9DINO|nr:unnamed protein product [Symbiodinium natans]
MAETRGTRGMDKSGPTGQVDSWTMPLTVTPKGAMYSVPFVLGLDAYSYKVGKHMASRVETRVKMSVRETSSTSAAKRPASATPARLVQAGVNGSTTFLWNSDGAHSSDSGASQVRKKRQKRTDDLLHELVMTCGDPIDVVSHWFEIFAFYCDPPEAIALPRLPERREAKDIFIDKIDMPAVQSLSCPTSRQSTKRPARRGRTRSFSAPRLRKTEMVRVQSPSLDNEKKLDLMRSDLYKTRSVLKEAGLAGKGAGHLDLGHRLKAQSLNAESFASWMESFSFILNLQRPKADMAVPLGPKGKSNQGHQGHGGHGGHGGRGGRGGHGQRSHSPPRRRSVAPRRASDVENVTKRLLARLDQRVVLGSWELITGEEAKEASSSATSSDEELERRQKIAQSLSQTDARQIMLRSSSLAMLNSGMIKNKSKGADRAKPGYDDVVKTRARILSGISPAQMTVKNLTSFLALFGMQRKEAVERAAKYFLFAVPCSSHTRTTNQSLQLDDDENQEDGAWLQEKLPFEVFYRLMRALQGPKRSAKSGDFSSEIGKSYLASELLSRLLFCALVGHEGVHHSSGAAARFHDDASAQPVSVANLAHSLRLLLSHELLQSESSLEAQVQALAEFLCLVLQRSEACWKNATVEESGVSYNGFLTFMKWHPDAYVHLLFLLLPLSLMGPKFASEEMYLIRKGLSHRAGELRAKAATLTRQRQKRRLLDMCASLVQPWLEANNPKVKA